MQEAEEETWWSQNLKKLRKIMIQSTTDWGFQSLLAAETLHPWKQRTCQRGVATEVGRLGVFNFGKVLFDYVYFNSEMQGKFIG